MCRGKEGGVMSAKSLKELAKEVESTLVCNCDLDRWEPERTTGHSHVCRIHRAAVSTYRKARGLGT